LWTTLLVVVGTVAMVASVLYSVGNRVAGDSSGEPTVTAATEPLPTGMAVVTPTPTLPALARPEAAQTPTPSGALPSEVPEPTPAVVVDVEVLNQTSRSGLAARAGEEIGEAGWPVVRVDNAALGSPATTLYVPVGLEPAAESFVRSFPAVTRTRPAFEGLPPSALTLVLAEPDAEDVVGALKAAGLGAPSDGEPVQPQ
jgi:hypothetical protein